MRYDQSLPQVAAAACPVGDVAEAVILQEGAHGVSQLPVQLDAVVDHDDRPKLPASLIANLPANSFSA